MEMYEQQKPFKLNDFILLSNFLNMFLYKAVLGNLFGGKCRKLLKECLFWIYFRFENNSVEFFIYIITYFIDGIVQTRLQEKLY